MRATATPPARIARVPRGFSHAPVVRGVAPATATRGACARTRASKVPDGSNIQGGLSKKPCDRCEGTGVVKCFTCNDIGASGWTIDGSTARCDKPGMVPVMKGGVFGFGAKKVGEEKCKTCAGSKKVGTIVCSRCQGNKFLYYRNSDWR